MDNLRLQEKVMIRDRIIEGKVFYPIYHYDQRILALRKSVEFWYQKSQNTCKKLTENCKKMREFVEVGMADCQKRLSQ